MPCMLLDGTGSELERYLSYLSQRQGVIASNMANADTPGYKTRDVQAPTDFSQALTEASLSPAEAEGLKTRNDGNNVDLDREARLLADSTLRFNLATQMVRGEIRSVRSAIEEGRSA